MSFVSPNFPLNVRSASPSTSCSKCPSCQHPVIELGDKYCRKCGIHVFMQCSKCSLSVKPDDRFCAQCGTKRYQLIEFWRYGNLHKSPIFVVSVSIITALAYVGLLINSKRHRS